MNTNKSHSKIFVVSWFLIIWIIFGLNQATAASISWNTFLGGNGDELAQDIAVDKNGDIYITGRATATWGTPIRAFSGGKDGFVAKLDATGNLIWHTFLGGTSTDICISISLDSTGHIYVGGNTNGSSWGTPVRNYTGSYDSFFAKLDNSGNLLWNTFLGGSGHEWANAIIRVDTNDNIYVVGTTYGVSWGSPIRSHTSGNDGYAAKLTSNGILVWNTFLGGHGDDFGYNLITDDAHIYVVGMGNTSWGNPLHSFSGGAYDAVLSKLDSNGTLIWNTFIGGSGDDRGYYVEADSNNIYVHGNSGTSWGSPIMSFSNGSTNSFIAKLTNTGTLIWNSFLGNGGSGGVDVLSSGEIYVSGYSTSPWGNPEQAFSGANDAFAAKLSDNGNLMWNTFIGESASAIIKIDGDSNIILAGSDTTTWGTPIRAYTNGTDAYVAKLSTCQDTNGSTEDGKAECRNNPTLCGITPDPQDGSTAEGIAYCQNNPTACNLFNQIQLDNAVQAAIDDYVANLADAVVGCQSNPSSCGLFTQADLDNTIQTTINACVTNPTDCGITVAPSRLINISARAGIAGGAYDMFGGFVIQGSGLQKVLVRGIAVDPGVDPAIKVLNHSTKADIATNDNWLDASNANDIQALPTAYQLPDRNGNDAGLLLFLPAGVYDVQLSSNNAHGVALIGVDAIN